LRLQVNAGGGSFKSQFKKADKSSADYALILGDNELENQQAALKPLRTEQEQYSILFTDLIAHLRQLTQSNA